ncbi:MAG: haloacid dehalogenase-like hydrolase, partial [Candidatus Brocadiales bacterium]
MRRHPKLIIFDLDGVIFKGQYLLRLSRRVGLFGHLRNLYRCLLYEMGVLPIDVLLREVYASFEGIRLAELRKAYDEMTLARGADQAVRELKARGAEVVIMSSGVPDLIVRDVADRLGADKGHGIEVGVAGEALSGEIGGELIVADGKRIVIEKLMRDGGIGWEDVMVVADDINNLGVMMKAGIS